MKALRRRDFLRLTGLGGAALLSEGLFQGVFGETQSPCFRGFKELKFTAAITPVTLGGDEPFKAWTYNGQVPGPPIRVEEGKPCGSFFRTIFRKKPPSTGTGCPYRTGWMGLLCNAKTGQTGGNLRLRV